MEDQEWEDRWEDSEGECHHRDSLEVVVQEWIWTTVEGREEDRSLVITVVEEEWVRWEEEVDQEEEED